MNTATLDIDLATLSQDTKHITLFPSELESMLREASVTITSTFRGEVPLSFLKVRAKEIISKNPWLNARLKTDQDDKCLRLCFQEDNLSTSPFFEYYRITDICAKGASINDLLEESNSPSISHRVLNLYAKQGIKCIDNDEALFKIRACQSDDGQFILTVSMSHIAGDATTIYQIYKMLNPASAVIALQPNRCFQLLED
jgi:hypothetical protein